MSCVYFPQSWRQEDQDQGPSSLGAWRGSSWFADGCLLTCPQLAKAEPLSCPFLDGHGPHVWGCTCTNYSPPAGPPQHRHVGDEALTCERPR